MEPVIASTALGDACDSFGSIRLAPGQGGTPG